MSSSCLPGEAITELAAELRLADGAVLLDLACGRGGYGLEVAARTGARLIGVDFDAEALSQAEGLAGQLGRAAQFKLGTLTECGLPDHSVDGQVPGRVRTLDLAAGLTAAGFAEVQVAERPGWRVPERAMWEEAAALTPGDNPALQSFHDEGVRVLAYWDLLRRVLATATATAS